MSRKRISLENQPHTPGTQITNPSHNANIALSNQQGFSLIEMLITVGLSSILVYGIGSLMNVASSQSESLREKIRFESESYQLSFYLKHIVSMGLGVELVDGVDLNTQNSTIATANPNTGFIRTYDFANNYTIGDAAEIDTIGYFLRETLTSAHVGAAPGAESRFRPTAIYFQKPTETTFGVIYIDLGTDQSAGATAMLPDMNDLRFEGIVDLKINLSEAEVSLFDITRPEATNPVQQRISSLTFKITHREYFAAHNNLKTFKWCPSRFMDQPECATNEQYRDVEQVVRVVLRNNVLGLSKAQILQNDPLAYSLPALQAIPRNMPMERRPFEFVYFLKAAYPLGQLKR